MRYGKKIRRSSLYTGKEPIVETVHEEGQMLYLFKKGFKLVIRNFFKELKGTISKELK